MMTINQLVQLMKGVNNCLYKSLLETVDNLNVGCGLTREESADDRSE